MSLGFTSGLGGAVEEASDPGALAGGFVEDAVGRLPAAPAHAERSSVPAIVSAIAAVQPGAGRRRSIDSWDAAGPEAIPGRGIAGMLPASFPVEPNVDNVENEEFLRATLGSMDLVYNIARRMVPRPEDAQDLVQETYLAAFKAWREHRRPRKVEPWLATICLNLARSGFRHRARRPQEVSWDEAAAALEADPEREAIAELDRQALKGALWSLPEEQRVAIALVDLAGFSTAEAAEVMRTPRGTVLSRLHRGRRALASMLGAQVQEREP